MKRCQGGWAGTGDSPGAEQSRSSQGTAGTRRIGRGITRLLPRLPLRSQLCVVSAPPASPLHIFSLPPPSLPHLLLEGSLVS